ncbi:MAG: hypothetical protein WC886_08735 [Saccharofermentanaceae bacterium]
MYNPNRIIKFRSFDELSYIESHPDLFKPIPLNKDILLNFHSVDEIEVSARFQNELTIYDRFLFIWKEEYEFWYVVTADHKEYLTKIEFVHEYQNFIFALTGQELELK